MSNLNEYTVEGQGSLGEEPLMILGEAQAKAEKKAQLLLATQQPEKKTQLNNLEGKKSSWTLCWAAMP